MMEVWKDVKGYEGLYQVSNFGNVKILSRRVVNHKSGSTRLMQEKLMNPFDNGHGYLVVSLRKGGKRKNHYVHRIVAEAFIANQNNKLPVNHKDRNTKNNSVTNLEWCTQQENVAYAAPQMRKPKTICRVSNTGEKYISKRLDHGKNIRYRVTIKALGIDKLFTDLADAVRYRNEVMKKWQNQ